MGICVCFIFNDDSIIHFSDCHGNNSYGQCGMKPSKTTNDAIRLIFSNGTDNGETDMVQLNKVRIYTNYKVL